MAATKVIRVDAQVYEVLKTQAQAFETPNSVVRRLLGLHPATKPSRSSPETGRKNHDE